MRIDENGVLRLDEDVEKLIKERKPEEAYALLCSKYPSSLVEKLQTDSCSEEEFYQIPYPDSHAISLGVEFLKWRPSINSSTYEDGRKTALLHPDLAKSERAQEVRRQLLISSNKA